MPSPLLLEKALLQDLDPKFERPLESGKKLLVQFNPETLKVTYSNQVKPPEGGGGQPQPVQYVGEGTMKLALQLWFDVTTPPYALEGVDDVRTLTQQVAYFITPRPAQEAGGAGSGAGGGQTTQLAPPAVRFLWGSFQFDGIMEALDESLEFWSPEGKPLRASMSFSLSRPKILVAPSAAPGLTGLANLLGAGTRPLAQAAAGATVQDLAARAGRGADWQSIAAANQIEDPLRLSAGQLVDVTRR